VQQGLAAQAYKQQVRVDIYKGQKFMRGDRTDVHNLELLVCDQGFRMIQLTVTVVSSQQ
jgi:hypothetical protein